MRRLAAVSAFVVVLAFAVTAIVLSRPVPSPRCYWPNPGCDCWYTCDANWHPSKADLKRFGGEPLPTVVNGETYFHWLACSADLAPKAASR